MNKFSCSLLEWYDNNAEIFPWRETNDPYKIWVSEIMLQQTQVKTVIPYYNKWVKKFPTFKDVAKASDDQIFKCWEGLGYYKRVNHLREACISIKNNKCLPKTKKDLLELKGIGDYTASAVASIAFNEVEPVIDVNVKRVMARILSLSNFKTASIKKIYKYLLNKICIDRPGDFNQALMDFGRNICTPTKPLCQVCIISEYCKSFKDNTVNKFPIKIKTKKLLPHYNIGIAVIWNNNKILITKRKKNTLLGGLWEFPGGKIENNELVIDCIKREIKEELNINIEVKDFIIKVKHRYSHFSITLFVHHCNYLNGTVECLASDAFKWINPNSFDKYPFPKANHYIFPEIKSQPC